MAKKKKKKKGRSLLKPFAILVLVVAAILVVMDWANRKKHEKPKKQHASTSLAVPKGYRLAGIDVSHHNGPIDWASVKEQGVTFAYLKTTEGLTKIDKDYDEDYDLVKEQEMYVGSYHFFLFNRDGAKQAQFFLENMRFEEGDLPPVVDVEYSPFNIRCMNKKVLQERLKQLDRFDSVVYSKTNRHIVIYTNKQGYEDLIRGNFKDCELWLCDLSGEPNEEKYPDWVIWQYCHKGSVDGIQTKVDMNVFRENMDTFDDWISNKKAKAPKVK